ncbi:hypothetical protein [Mucilaginibacter sp. HD30]
MNTRHISYVPYVMLFITLLLIAGTTFYLSYSETTEQTLLNDKHIVLLNGPWKFKIGDSMEYSRPGYDDSDWQTMDLTAPAGVHDDDVGLSGFIQGWTTQGHANYAGYAWYRLKVRLDSLTRNNLALAAPPAVDDAYQLFINGSLLGNAGDFSGNVPKIYSIRPHMFVLPENVKKGKDVTIAFRVWMSPANLGPGTGGIHIAPALGEKTHMEKKYSFQWNQTIKGYIVEVILPVMFILLAATVYLVNKNSNQTRSCKWFITALVLLGLVRLNQATYYWFQFESADLAVILGTAILRPLMLGSWLMAWLEWFGLRQPKWLPIIIAILTSLYMTIQVLGISWVSNSTIHLHYEAIAGYIRLLLLAILLVIACLGIRKQGIKDRLVSAALLFLTIALFPAEVSALHVIPGIWFPYGVGVSRGQFFYVFFVLVMYAVLIRKNRIVEIA